VILLVRVRERLGSGDIDSVADVAGDEFDSGKVVDACEERVGCREGEGDGADGS